MNQWTALVDVLTAYTCLLERSGINILCRVCTIFSSIFDLLFPNIIFIPRIHLTCCVKPFLVRGFKIGCLNWVSNTMKFLKQLVMVWNKRRNPPYQSYWCVPSFFTCFCSLAAASMVLQSVKWSCVEAHCWRPIKTSRGLQMSRPKSRIFVL